MNAPVMRTAEANAASVVEPATGHSVLSNLPMFVLGLSGLAWARCQSECSPAVAKRNGVRRWPDADGCVLCEVPRASDERHAHIGPAPVGRCDGRRSWSTGYPQR